MTTDKIKTVVVAGAGTMGPGIAAVYAVHGYTTILTDISEEIIEKGKKTVDIVYNVLIAQDYLTEDQVAEGRKNLSFSASIEDVLADADLVLESIPERIEVKQAFFSQVEALVRPDTILASNTSGIPITKISEACKNRDRVVGMHWSNPPHIIPVIEVIKGDETEQATVDTLWEVIEDIEMVPVLVRRDVAGFVENRVLYAVMRECLHLLDEGIASAEDIDTVVKWGIGYKLAVIGPMELLDMAGLDIYSNVASYLNADLSNASGVSKRILEKVEAGELGIKTGKGLFDYTPESIPPLMQKRMGLLLKTKKILADWLQ